ncbi:hypothetical protein HYX04_04475 [Candidatus Woesearchaeota archaeon]|nr:hypothetical protein [Candidatus Woesearchaeota archaeon]
MDAPNKWPLYVVVARDDAGLYCGIRRKYEIFQTKKAVAIFKDGILTELLEQAERFIQENKSEDARLLTRREITNLL